ncbi:YdcF family protein [Bombilactobacillus folatiphilus]|uniref:YdcF family protein n=1 Tax=Bombilactobacillus folatiphilus TaxID=2923362 RepID=A0ABY4PA56_9LACO|nr:YdcF family protein [Bombilactobacillus folatiphilus]UQS82526.1 YdcF family protein [Bombilactobacillus folatiphilus]
MNAYNLMIVLWSLTGLFSITLIVSLHQNKFRLLNGALTNLILFTFGVASVVSAQTLRIHWLYLITYIIITIIYGCILILYLSLGFLLLWNAIIVWHKENHSLTNNLTLILGIGFLLLPLIRLWTNNFLSEQILILYKHVVAPIVIYILFWFLAFVTSFLITRLYHPKFDQDYIIILGAGLFHGDQVSPLLASRVDVALNFARKQVERGGHFPLIICSGGQGDDETIPEGQAMKNYVLAQGIAPKMVVSEEKSRNTYENMKFSQQIVYQHQLNPHRGIFATSDYHTFRAAGYARFVGLNISGIGAKTSRFFIPNAFLREYLALLANHKIFHICCLTFILGVSLFDVWAWFTN